MRMTSRLFGAVLFIITYQSQCFAVSIFKYCVPSPKIHILPLSLDDR